MTFFPKNPMRHAVFDFYYFPDGKLKKAQAALVTGVFSINRLKT